MNNLTITKHLIIIFLYNVAVLYIHAVDDFEIHWNYHVAIGTDQKYQKFENSLKIYKTFTEMLPGKSRCGIQLWNFQNGCRYHRNKAKTSKMRKCDGTFQNIIVVQLLNFI